MDFEIDEATQALLETARRFAKEKIIPVAADCDEHEKFPVDVYKEAHALGFVAATIPEQYGGAGLDAFQHAVLCEELGYARTGIQTSIVAGNLAATPVIVGGTEEQKKKYLGMLTSEPIFASYATTEPAAGSDVA